MGRIPLRVSHLPKCVRLRILRGGMNTTATPRCTASRLIRAAFLVLLLTVGGIPPLANPRARAEETAEVLKARDTAAAASALKQGKYPEAEMEYRAALEIRRRTLGPEHRDTLQNRNSIANMRIRQGKFAEAEKEYRETLEVRTRVSGADHPLTLSTRTNLAKTLNDSGRNAEAEKEHRAVLEIRQRQLGPEHPDSLQSLSHLADSLRAQQKHAESEAAYRTVLDARKRALGPEHPDVFHSSYNLALSLEAQKKYAQALGFARFAEEGLRKYYRADSPSMKNATALVKFLEKK
jgi:hypothetical protein